MYPFEIRLLSFGSVRPNSEGLGDLFILILESLVRECLQESVDYKEEEGGWRGSASMERNFIGCPSALVCRCLSLEEKAAVLSYSFFVSSNLLYCLALCMA